LGHNKGSTKAYILSERAACLANSDIVKWRHKWLSGMFSLSLVLQESFFQEHQKSAPFIVRHGHYQLKKLVCDSWILQVFIYVIHSNNLQETIVLCILS
jgi:hypothetical protein